MNEVILWLDFTVLIVEAGAKGVVCGPEDTQLADNCTVLFLPRLIRACPLQRLRRIKHVAGAKRVPGAVIETSQPTETTVTENTGPPGLVGVGRGA